MPKSSTKPVLLNVLSYLNKLIIVILLLSVSMIACSNDKKTINKLKAIEAKYNEIEKNYLSERVKANNIQRRIQIADSAIDSIHSEKYKINSINDSNKDAEGEIKKRLEYLKIKQDKMLVYFFEERDKLIDSEFKRIKGLIDSIPTEGGQIDERINTVNRIDGLVVLLRDAIVNRSDPMEGVSPDLKKRIELQKERFADIQDQAIQHEENLIKLIGPEIMKAREVSLNVESLKDVHDFGKSSKQIENLLHYSKIVRLIKIKVIGEATKRNGSQLSLELLNKVISAEDLAILLNEVNKAFKDNYDMLQKCYNEIGGLKGWKKKGSALSPKLDDLNNMLDRIKKVAQKGHNNSCEDLASAIKDIDALISLKPHLAVERLEMAGRILQEFMRLKYSKLMEDAGTMRAVIGEYRDFTYSMLDLSVELQKRKVTIKNIESYRNKFIDFRIYNNCQTN